MLLVVLSALALAYDPIFAFPLTSAVPLTVLPDFNALRQTRTCDCISARTVCTLTAASSGQIGRLC